MTFAETANGTIRNPRPIASHDRIFALSAERMPRTATLSSWRLRCRQRRGVRYDWASGTKAVLTAGTVWTYVHWLYDQVDPGFSGPLFG